MLTGEILSASAARLPDKAAVIGGGRTITFAELDRAATRFANALIGLGLGKGHAIAMLSSNQPDYPAVYFGAARSGAILAHMSVRYTPDDLAGVMERTGTIAVVVHAPLLDTILGIRDRLPQLRHVIVFGGADSDGPLPEGVLALDGLIAGAVDTPPAVGIAATDPYAITYTGGTTGIPKAVLVSHYARTNSSLAAQREFGLRGVDVALCSTPLFHVAGLYVWFQTAILMGCTCVLMESWDAGRFMDMVERDKVSAAFLVPTQLHGIVSHPDFDPARLTSLRYVNYAGSPMPVALLERLIELLPDVTWVEHYGQSEVCPLTVRQPEFLRAKPTSVGRALKGVDLAIVGADGAPLGPDEPGEVVARAETRLVEYYKDPEQTAALAVGPEGWLRTGDIGYLDEDGFLFLVDRSKDMIISGGENVYPAEIEAALYRHDAVAECAVFGIPDDHWGEVPAAHVVLADGSAATEQDLVDFCAGTIPRHKRPRLVKFVNALPKTAIGKIQKNVLREPYWKGTGRAI